MDAFVDGEFFEAKQQISEVIKLQGGKLSLQLICINKCEPEFHCQEGAKIRDSVNQLDMNRNKPGNWDMELVK